MGKKKNSFDIGVFTPNPEITLSPLQRSIGKHIPIVLIFSPWKVQWKNDPAPFPLEKCRLISKNKSIPFIKWEPATWTDIPNKMINDFPLEHIINGKHDKYIMEWAIKAKEFKNEIWLSFGHEMNGSWYYWSNKPKKFKKALSHIYKIFSSIKTNNIKWVFCVNNYPIDYMDYIPNELKNDQKTIIAIDGYNADGIWGLRWSRFKDIFKGPYEYVKENLPNNKLIIGEIGCSENGGNKGEWLKDMFDSMNNEFSGISSIIWFNINKEADWRINSSKESFESFRSLM